VGNKLRPGRLGSLRKAATGEKGRQGTPTLRLDLGRLAEYN
jgi:hypothetical protein